MLLFMVGLLCKSNPVDARLITTFNNGSRWGHIKSSRYKVHAEFLNAINFASTIGENYFLFTEAICIKSANLNPFHLFILTIDYNSTISTDNISILIVWIYSPASISNPKKTKNYSFPGNESQYSCKKYRDYFKDIAKNNRCLFSSHFTPDSITKKTNAIYNINLGELVSK